MAYSTTLTAVLNRSSGWLTTLAAELDNNPPTLSDIERQTLLAVANVPYASTNAYESLTAARTLTVDDGSKTFGLNLAGGFTVTLPLISTLPAGWSARFRAEIAPTGDYIVIANATDLDKMAGHILSSSGGAEDTEATNVGDQVNFLAAAGVGKIGDWVEISTNGVSWFARGECATAAGMTITG